MKPEIAREVLRNVYDIRQAAKISKVPEEILTFFVLFGTLPDYYWQNIHFNLDILSELRQKKRKKRGKNNGTV